MNDLFSIQEKLLIHLIRHVTKDRNQELIFLNRDILTLNQMKEPFDKLSYSQAIDILCSNDIKIQDGEVIRKIEWGDDLNIDSEKLLTKDRRNPVFVYGYPLQVKPFYVKEDPEKTRNCPYCGFTFARWIWRGKQWRYERGKYSIVEI